MADLHRHLSRRASLGSDLSSSISFSARRNWCFIPSRHCSLVISPDWYQANNLFGEGR